MKRKEIANSTLAILENGTYLSRSGSTISIDADVKNSLEGTQYYTPEELVILRDEVLNREKPYAETNFTCFNETTLEGSRELSNVIDGKIGVLNFASAKNPGGGFLNGAHAQEESLARSSALYKSLLLGETYYTEHRQMKSCLYSDRMIYSPNTVVFRTDNGTLIEEPYVVDFVTSPAPNARVVKRKEPEAAEKIEPSLYERGAKVLSLFVERGCTDLVLGAWGCGVFQNDPEMVAEMFYSYLKPGGQFHGSFRSVRFSVLDTRKEQKIFAAFEKRFGN